VLNLDLRRIGALPSPPRPPIRNSSARIGWTVSHRGISLNGSNLIHPHHLEFGTTAAPLQLGSTGVESGRSFLLEFALAILK